MGPVPLLMAGGPAASSRLAGEEVLRIEPTASQLLRLAPARAVHTRSTPKWHPQVALAATPVGTRAMSPTPSLCYCLQGGGDAHGRVYPGHLLITIPSPRQAEHRPAGRPRRGCTSGTAAASAETATRLAARPPCPLPATHPVPEAPWRGPASAQHGMRRLPFIRTAPGWGRASGFPAGRTAAPGMPQNRL